MPLAEADADDIDLEWPLPGTNGQWRTTAIRLAMRAITLRVGGFGSMRERHPKPACSPR
ncbi:protein of unknown function [Thauera humireducens]|nr:protein of unknown function [Thauera humireducens]